MRQVTVLIKKRLKIFFKNIAYPKKLTCYPEQPQKSRLKIFAENLIWILRFYQANEFYYLLGFDLKDNRQCRQKYINARKCFKLLNKKKKRLSKDYKLYDIVIHDKFIASQYIQSLGFPAPETIALINNNSILIPKSGEELSLKSMLAEREELLRDCICKPIGDFGGHGVFHLHVNNGIILVDGKKGDYDYLYSLFCDSLYILQKKVIQHEAMSKLNPGSVNTIRLVTYWHNNTVRPFAAGVKIGLKNNVADNWRTGGVLIRLNIETGRLGRFGFTHPEHGGKRVERHPETNILFDSYEIPYCGQAVELVKKLHKYFYATYSIGWDIAITQNGPVFIEGNQQWDPYLHIVLEDNFMDNFSKISL